ncbi:MAG TPA: rod shape-determining protein RodA [Fermentimonas caenicola]|jgi:rod shape determining protein RodA|uniref:Cell wall polymerase n=1 Tax=Fermentimonas caenicola TaxID=1562970 RepID=A0A098C2B5_9BACT|nr:rod shape-determining protein RodA [Lascolabacillus sp.]MDI9625822.1 rod shape-determining protein RodA [Bacteroidota bacterium]TAH61741.1 MAG: rod shape-determining protein RodA [Fermentimonas caenicola]MDD2607571.1 rod shape-determining protein RodA [Lascolabacillus sp.]MDD3658538.1 rod shape-determining protein RodA [Lascolabacillus sp.]MDD4758930.1 rod shape-determining protein RodA [Lascolabacillus sp.]
MIKHTGIEIEEKGKVDRITLFLYLLFVVIGWFNIYAASYDLENATGMFDLSTRAGSQLIWIGTSLLIAFSLIKIEVSFYETYSFLFYLIGIFLLVVTLIVAQEINGSRSWLIIGPVRLQPAEFMKFIISLALAKVLNTYDFKLMDKKNLMLVSSIIILPTLLVIFQSETGTALVYLSLILVLYREGLPGGVLFMGIAAIIYFILGIRFSDEQIGMLSKGEIMTVVLIIIFSAGMVWSYLKRKRTFFIIILISSVPFLIALILYFFSETIDWGMFSLISLGVTALHLLYLFLRYRVKTYFYIFLFLIVSFGFLESTEYVFNDVLQPHQQMRIKVTLGMEQDLSGAGYHVGQSKIAIGSGGLTGKGYLNGTQTKLKYVPEQDTDFIFCTIGEEHGFIGSTIVMILFTVFVLRLLKLAERQTTTFGRVYGYSVVSIFFFHLLINIGMVIGIMPVIGIPLPFFSYGGSSLWGFTILLFIFLRIDKSRKRG